MKILNCDDEALWWNFLWRSSVKSATLFNTTPGTLSSARNEKLAFLRIFVRIVSAFFPSDSRLILFYRWAYLKGEIFTDLNWQTADIIYIIRVVDKFLFLNNRIPFFTSGGINRNFFFFNVTKGDAIAHVINECLQLE